ncbi:hypothetical protein SAMN05216185_11774 [Pseudomonas guariconensis]|nr:hypothetical protein SAMN05216185_11774 [Pseudomonas guariconensis]
MMARSRNIKPGFFSNEDLADLGFAARLLFIGMWTEADREGRLEDRPKRLKMALFPADNVDIEGMLDSLAEKGFIRRYEACGVKAIQVVNWSKHQNPHVKEAASTIPAEGEKPPVQGDYGASTGQAPDKHGSFPADSLSLDSLNLIPDSLTSSSESPAELFAKFWKLYPRKVGKANAEKAWAKLKVDAALFNRMATALAAWSVSADWTKDGGQFIPHPATWLNGKRWDDELPSAGNVHQFPPRRQGNGPDFDDTSWADDLGVL